MPENLIWYLLAAPFITILEILFVLFCLAIIAYIAEKVT